MKLTAEQLAINISTDLANGVIDQQRIIDIQEYGRQCAEQALKDAANNSMQEWKQSGMTNLAERSKKTIESTEIITP